MRRHQRSCLKLVGRRWWCTVNCIPKIVSPESDSLPDWNLGKWEIQMRIQCTCLFGDFGLLAFGAGTGALLCLANKRNHLAYCFLGHSWAWSFGGIEDSKAVVMNWYILLRVPSYLRMGKFAKKCVSRAWTLWLFMREKFCGGFVWRFA